MFARKASFLLGAALVAAAVTPPVKADEWNKKTVITINEAVQLPSCCDAGHVVVLIIATLLGTGGCFAAVLGHFEPSVNSLLSGRDAIDRIARPVEVR